jgi:transposase
MAPPFSTDLRLRVVDTVEKQEMSPRATAARFSGAGQGRTAPLAAVITGLEPDRTELCHS